MLSYGPELNLDSWDEPNRPATFCRMVPEQDAGYSAEMRTRITSALLASTMAAIISFGSASLAAVHFALTRSSPAADQALEASPKRLQAWFSQMPAEGVSRLTLMTAEKKEVPNLKTAIDKESKSMYVDLATPLGAGAYILGWRGAGDDGHVMTGEIKFTITAKVN